MNTSTMSPAEAGDEGDAVSPQAGDAAEKSPRLVKSAAQLNALNDAFAEDSETPAGEAMPALVETGLTEKEVRDWFNRKRGAERRKDV